MHRNTNKRATSGRAQCTTRQRATYQDDRLTSRTQIRNFILRALVTRARQIRDSNIFYLSCARRTVPEAYVGYGHRSSQQRYTPMETDTNSIDYNDVSYVIKSGSRVTVLLELTDGMSTPSKIAEGTDIDMAHVSRALGELRDQGIVDLIVDEETKKGRLYRLSDGTSDAFVETVREVTGE